MIAGRVLLFAVIDASAWPAALVRYLFPVMPLVPVAIILLATSVRGEQWTLEMRRQSRENAN
jgi:hypothetical protein